ncbi:PTS sugar transporter subunit IIB [bacterium 1XD21-13]|nr:PTS sugar transporter subunit IIB [bacterium 1XD21-13]
MKKILLCCGSGASSGFMAKNANVAAKARGLDFSIKARSESEVEDYLEEIDLIMVGPHFKHRLNAIKEMASEYHVPAELIDGTVYGSLNGDGLIDQIINILK